MLHTSVSIPYRPQGLDRGPAETPTPFSRPSSAFSGARISLSPAGLRADLASVPRALAFAQAASSHSSLQHHSGAQTDSARPSTGHRPGQQTTDSEQSLAQVASAQPPQNSQSFKGSRQRPHSAKTSTLEPHLARSRIQRPQSAKTHTVQPPFWTGRMQQTEPAQASSAKNQMDEGLMQQSQSDEGSQQKPQSCAASSHRPQSEGHGASRLSQAQKLVSPGAATGSPHSALRTVPEDFPTALQPGPFKQGSPAEGRAGSLRAWRGMHSQPCTSEAANETASLGQNSHVRHSSSRPLSAQQQHGKHRQTPESEAHDQQADPAHMQLDQENALPVRASLRSGTPPKPRGRSTLTQWQAPNQAAALDLTEQER